MRTLPVIIVAVTVLTISAGGVVGGDSTPICDSEWTQQSVSQAKVDDATPPTPGYPLCYRLNASGMGAVVGDWFAGNMTGHDLTWAVEMSNTRYNESGYAIELRKDERVLLAGPNATDPANMSIPVELPLGNGSE